MMMNLFSTFDPSTGSMSLNWISSIIFMSIMPMKFWLTSNKQMKLINNLLMSMNQEMKNIMLYKGTSILSLMILMWIMINNSMGLIPYIYTSSSQMSFSLSIALPAWLGMMMFGWINKTNSMLTHLLPVGTPTLLMPLMVMIETISNFIRPGSLAVRLVANMIAGHLLMSLLGNNTSQMSILMIVFIILLSFEIAVSMIQSYVFMTLLTLYSSEL